ncbi:MAG: hypothetical protein WCO16_02515 [bacterium]
MFIKPEFGKVVEGVIEVTNEITASLALISTSSVEDVAEAREFLNECQQLVEININPKLGSN